MQTEPMHEVQTHELAKLLYDIESCLAHLQVLNMPYVQHFAGRATESLRQARALLPVYKADLRGVLGDRAYSDLVYWATENPEAAEAELREVCWGVPVKRDPQQLELPL